ncbi:ABC transporter ATP-binding protein [Corynebacterium heidelbergense]|uniref:Spermidine/putrescine ABC transporter ATP-binding protein n=1 Tax=Corynebacterium heidelbergense TaxID=2055947 RepID=A0A364V8F9_9CORY|nr:ABC transporter ATP-binding protein [Corynebacterium heidelbergense]RAV32921.1 spermidine/putrescine ABC transporter ATP-binding protein [Corynebacterium heidelbergense]WCZ36564.1 Daunorubicin/doxorubicin resistance ATP-binding protein DrrA [Corynebacterium heidelbergense]
MTTAGSTPLLDVRSVVRRFGKTIAVDGLDFHVDRSEVVCVLGPNGAGKTTTIEMCEGFQRPDSGSVRVFGMDPFADSDKVRERIGVMLQGGGAYPGIRVGEMLRLVASYSAHPLDTEWLLHTVGLERQRKTTFRRLSGGQQQRLALACALVGRPELVFLDEPTAGLDAQSRLLVWDLISSLRRDGVSVVLTTHLLDEAEALSDRVVIIDRGTVVAQGSPAELTTSLATATSGSRIVLQLDGVIDVPSFVDATCQRAGLGVPTDDDRGLTMVRIRPGSYALNGPHPTPGLLTAVTQAAADQGVLITSLDMNKTSLEDVFLSITGRQMRG